MDDNVTVCFPLGEKIGAFHSDRRRVWYWLREQSKGDSESAYRDAFSRDGGLLLEMDSGGRMVWSFSKVEHPGLYLDLAPSGDISVVRFGPNLTSVSLDRGHYIFFPVNRAAAERLQHLKSALEVLPGDMRRSLQAFLRKPMIEWRIGVPERSLGLKSPAIKSNALGDKISNKVVAIGTLALVLLAVVMIFLAPKPSAPVAVQQTISKLPDAPVNKKKLANSVSEALSDLQFKLITRASTSRTSPAEQLRSVDLAAAPNETLESALLAIIAAHSPPPANELPVASLPKALSDQPEIREALLAVGCSIRGRPEIGSGPLIYRPEGASCNGINDRLAASGVRRLGEWTIQQRPAPVRH